MSSLEEWIRSRQVEEVECLVPDMSGVARGKILPSDKFLKGAAEDGLRLPETVFVQCVTGDSMSVSDVADPANSDIWLRPDQTTIRRVPWYDDPTAQVICDAFYPDGKPVDIASRDVLRRIMALYEKKGWMAVVAPELEFYLVKINTDPDYPLEPPVGRSGRQESGRQAFGIDAANEFDPLMEDVYDFCEAQEIDIDTLAHEAGAAQFEINFNHGDPMALADQVFLFKRTVRQAALRHDVYATFMAKPHQNEPGSAMHIHQSVIDRSSGENLFSTRAGKDSKLFLHHVGGLQRYLPAAMPLLAPNVNSYRRLMPYSDAPINVHWGHDNRTVGLRVPHSDRANRRVENRVAGVDANPYLAIAASLACGWLGMTERIEPSNPVEGNAYRYAFSLSRHLTDALSKLNHSRPLKDVLGDRFVAALNEVKMLEYNAYQKVISSWERENLLLNV
ncbi:MAG: glutamine synthetase family protein [Alphaproteobacteria bacterium]|nr:glutamine synthetase family protein [Alphaproteobacteria bacterium]